MDDLLGLSHLFLYNFKFSDKLLVVIGKLGVTLFGLVDLFNFRLQVGKTLFQESILLLETYVLSE